MSCCKSEKPLKPYVLETLVELRETLSAIDHLTATRPEHHISLYTLRERILEAIDTCVSEIASFLNKHEQPSASAPLNDVQKIDKDMLTNLSTKLPDCL